MTHDKQGREWAKMSQLKAGDEVECDSGFTCGINKATATVKDDGHGLYISCDQGKHYLVGQLESDGDSLIGLYPVA